MRINPFSLVCPGNFWPCAWALFILLPWGQFRWTVEGQFLSWSKDRTGMFWFLFSFLLLKSLCCCYQKGKEFSDLMFSAYQNLHRFLIYLFCRAHFGGTVGVKGVPDQKHKFWFMKPRWMGSIRVISAAGLWEAHGPFQVFHILGEDYKCGLGCLLISTVGTFPRCTNI